MGKLLLEKELKLRLIRATVKAVAVVPAEAARTTPELHRLCQNFKIELSLIETAVQHYVAALPKLSLIGKRERPTRGLMGQLVTARALLEKVHPDLRVKAIIRREKLGNKSLLSSCRELGIDVEPIPVRAEVAGGPG